MASTTPTQLPAFIQLRYDENGVFSRFRADADKATSSVAQLFNGAFSEVGKVAQTAARNANAAFGSLDLGVDKMREQAAQARLNEEVLLQLARAAQKVSNETGDTTASTRAYLTSLTEQIAVARRVATAADEQLATYSRMQDTVDGLTASNSRLAAAQREVYELSSRTPAAPSPANAPPTNTRTDVSALMAGQASIDRAALSSATLEQALGRVSVKSAELSAALRSKEAAERAATAATDEAAAAAQREAAAFQAQAQSLQMVAALEQEEARAKQQAALAANEAAARNIDFVEALQRAQQESLDAAAAEQQLAREMQRQAEAAEQMAQAVNRLEGQLDPAAAAAMRLAAQTKTLDDALEAGAIDAQRHAQMMQLVTAANHEGTTATRNVINSQGAMRVAMLQSGQQMQDFAIQVYSGQSASVAMAQQLPQLAFALSGLEGNTNKTLSKIGQFSTFLSGPWGLAVGLAAGIIGTLAYEFLGFGEEAEKATGKTYIFTDSLDVMKLKANEAADAMKQLASATASAILEQGNYLQNQSLIANQSVTGLEQQISDKQRQLSQLIEQTTTYSFFPKPFAGTQISALKDQIKDLNSALGDARQAKNNADIALSQQRVANSLDGVTAATNAYAIAVGKLNTQRAKSAALESNGDPLALATNTGSYLSSAEYEKQLANLQRTRDAAIEASRASSRTRRNSKRDTSAERAIREAQRLENFGDRAAESIQRINERFSDQPRLIVQAEQATRQLDAIIKDLSERKPIGFKDMIADAQAAKSTVNEALVRPFREMTEDAYRRLSIQEALAAGNRDEADALNEIFRKQQQLGNISAEQVAFTRSLVRYENERTRELERQQNLFEAQIDVLNEARASLTDVLSGRSTNLFGNIKQSLADLQGQRMFDNLFGNVFSDLENELRGKSPLGKESQRMADELQISTLGLEEFSAALRGTSAALGAANDNMGVGQLYSGVNGRLNGTANGNGYITPEGEIVVARPKQDAQKREVELARLSVQQLADKTAKGIVDPIVAALEEQLGTQFSQSLSGVLSSALGGYLTGGGVGGVLGALKGGIFEYGPDLFGKGATESILGGLNGAMKGAATGTTTAGIMNALGLGTSTTGSQIGGAIGSFIPIPGADILGSLAGGLFGNLFKKKPYGTASITSATADAAISGNKGSARDAASTLAGSVQDGLISIADQLNADLGSFAVSIGTYKDNYRVNVNGGSGKLGGYSGSASQNESRYGLYDFGDDQEAAIKFAISNAVQDGALLGLRKSTQTLLNSGSDLDAQLEKALDWENAFNELRSYTDPLGLAIDNLNKEFENLLDISKEAGASTEELADLEQLYGIKRAEIIKEQNEKLIGSLQDLYDNLTIGDNGLSLRARQANALNDYDALAARVSAGDTTAYDDYANAAQALLDIERQLYGSQQEYFDRLGEVTDLTKSRIDAETNIVSIADGSDSPFDSTGAVKSSVDSQTDILAAKLDAVNENIGTLINLSTATSSGSAARSLSFLSSY